MVVAQAVGLLQVAWGSWAVAWVVVVGLLQVAQAAVAVGLLLQLPHLLLLLGTVVGPSRTHWPSVFAGLQALAMTPKLVPLGLQLQVPIH